MQRENTSTTPSGAVIVASLFGILAGLGGIVHGIGEVLQGNVAPGGLVMDSWTQGPIATNMGGEPAMTIVPNLLVTGLLTIVISLAVLASAVVLIRMQHGAGRLVILSVAMLLVGGGFGPPIIGMLAGAAGTGTGGRLVPVGSRRLLARLWPWVFGVAAVSGTFLVVGSVILVCLFGLNNPDLFLNSFFITVLSLVLTVLLTPAYDAFAREESATL